MGIAIITCLLSAIISWGIAKFYYRRSSVDQNRLWGKFTNELRQILLDDPRTSLSVIELNELLENKTIERAPTGSPLPYKACPKCGSEELERKSSVNQQDDEIYYTIGCKLCGWGEWTQ